MKMLMKKDFKFKSMKHLYKITVNVFKFHWSKMLINLITFGAGSIIFWDESWVIGGTFGALAYGYYFEIQRYKRLKHY